MYMRNIHIIGVCIVFLFFGMPLYAHAQDTFLNISCHDVVRQKGYHATFYDTHFFADIVPEVCTGASDITLSLVAWQTAVPKELAADPFFEFVSNIYAYDAIGARSEHMGTGISVRIQPKHVRGNAAIYFFDKEKKQWQRTKSYRKKDGSYAVQLKFPFAQVAVLQEKKWIEKGVINATALPARAVGVADAKGSFLFTKNAYERLPLASLTKLMTVLVFLDKNPGWQKAVQIIAEDDAEPAKVAFQIGDRVYVKDLFYATLIGSKNNAAKALARSTGLSHEEFIKKMNEKAKALGMKQTAFVDATGLSADNTSTIEDFLKLGRVAFGNLNIAKAASMKTYTFQIIGTKRRMTVRSTNFLLANANFFAMGKTGHIDEAGYNFATRVKNKNQEILVVVFGATSGGKREEITDILIDFGFRQLAAAQSKKAKKT